MHPSRALRAAAPKWDSNLNGGSSLDCF